MGVMGNTVLSGDYKNGDIKVSGLRANKIVLVFRGLLGKKEIPIDKTTVIKFEINRQQYQQNNISLYFKDGKKSMCAVTNDMLNRLQAIFF